MVRSSPDQGSPTFRLVQDFLEAVEAGDSEGALSFLAPDFTLRSWDGNPMLEREGYLSAIGWDVASRARKEIEEVEIADDAVRLLLVETNAFTEIFELPPFRIETRFFVRDGVIREQRMQEVSTESGPTTLQSFHRWIAPILEWGREHARSLTETATGDDGALTYSASSARALLELVRRHREDEEEHG